MTSPAKDPPKSATFRRFVAIGDSTTEGLEDPDGQGGYRGWADRLAQHLADDQDEPLEYANLAVRGLRLSEIRNTQFDDALRMRPDLLSIFGGVNDAISIRWDAEAVHEDYTAMFSEARGLDATVLTFTMPDLTAVNPLARRIKDRILTLNAIIRAEADRYGVLVMDFERFPIAADPRLWFEDRLHGNSLGHERVAAALAARLGVSGFDDSWADPIGEELMRRRARDQVTGDLDWALHHLAPWVGKGIRGVSTARGVSAKRPQPAVVPRTGATPPGSAPRVGADRPR